MGGGLAVALSFVLISLRGAGGDERGGPPPRRIPVGSGLRGAGHILSAFGLLLAALAVASAWVGDPRSEDSLAPVLTWNAWWMGLTWLTLVGGNLWPVLDPWNTLRRIYGGLLRRPLSLGLHYPPGLARWPAVLLMVGFIWFELGWFQAREAGGVVRFFLWFTAWLWLGMAVFRPSDWWENAHPFVRYFRVLGRFAPAEGYGAGIELRIPGTALHATRLSHVSESVFVIVVLFAVTFDGFVATPEWWVLLRAAMLKSFQVLPRSLGFHASFLFAILAGLAVFTLAFFGVCAVMNRISVGATGVGALANDFAMTLIPIAAAYHIAHFIPALPARLTQLVRAAGDPFDLGWHLFGAHDFAWKVNWTPGTAGAIWVVQTGLIVLGHIISIWSAHRKALLLFPERRRAARAELPVALLMIAYTVVSLWIISRPILNEPLVPLPGISE